MTFAIDPGPLAPALEHACRRLEHNRFSEALWARRLDVWSSDPAVQRKVGARLGWLDAPESMQVHLPRLRAFADSVRHAAFTDVVLLGMGGSSLASDVLRSVAGVAAGYPRFHVLDSVDPDAVRAAMAHPATTLFILASKSGSTIELTSLAAEARRRVRETGVPEPCSHFVAITDEGTLLARQAADEGFRDVFINPSDIGGRFSALSLFGLVPASIMGLDVAALLESARRMAAQCRVGDPRRNPGVMLGAFMGAATLEGRDKLTLAMPPWLERLAVWVEQLVAESTGKQGKGVVPVIGGEHDPASGNDRIVAAVGPGATSAAPVERARAAGLPVMRLDVPDATELGGAFFCWEVATAAAGWLLDVNPFDEPNVQQAKIATRELLTAYTVERRLPVPEADAHAGGVPIVWTSAARTARPNTDGAGLANLIRRGDYFALLAYLPPDDPRFMDILESLRTTVARRTGCATTLGFGPRYLHSTGQLHKGGPNTGVFLLVTAEPPEDLPIPDEPYTFGVLELAQAIGDFQSLDAAGRRAVHLHLPDRNPTLLQTVTASILAG